MAGISTKTYGYNFIDDSGLALNETAGDVQTKNIAISFNKKQRKLVFTFEAKWSTGTGSSTVRANVSHDAGITRFTLGTITNPELGRWISYKYELDTSKYGTFGFKKETHDIALNLEELDNIWDKEPHPLALIPVEVDNDIMEHDVTIISNDFGDDSTPNIKFRVNNLGRMIKMKPYITVNGTSTDDAKVYFTDGSYEDLTNMDVSADSGNGGWWFVNGLKFTDITLFALDSFNNASMKFMDVDYFQITAPTFSDGHNNYDLNIKFTTS